MAKVVDPVKRREELADAAARVIARSGFDGASLRAVAAEAGWTTGALVHYFENKRELLTFTLQVSLDRRRARHAERENLPPTEALRATLFGSLPTTPDTMLHWVVTLAFAGQAHSDPALAAIQRDAYRDFRATISRLVAAIDGPTDGANAVTDEHEAERLIALIDGIALQAIFDPEGWPADRQHEALEAGLGLRH